MLLNHKNPRIISFPVEAKPGMIVSEIHLIPGVNQVEEAVLAQMQAHPTLAPMFESGELEVITDKKSNPVSSLSQLEEARALKVVAETNDVDLLHVMGDSDKRSKVKRAAEKKAKELDNPTDKDE